MTDGTSKLIAHASGALLPAEKNYSQIEKEALWIIFAVSKFHRFIHGRHFTLQTDHKLLLTLLGSKKGLPTHTANRLHRWGAILFNYNFKMVYLPSNKFGHEDGLSRLIPKYKEPLEDTVIASFQSEGELKITLCNSVREFPVTLDQIKQETLRDEYITGEKQKFWKKTSVLQTFSLHATMCYFTENASWFSRHCRNIFWKIFTLAIKGVIGWKVWCVALSIG